MLRLTDDDGVAASTGEGSAPIDKALSQSGHYLFTLSATNSSIIVHSVNHRGQLLARPGISGLPCTMNGLATF